MVDWDRVEELRSKGWDWDKIADDPKVGFHPDASVREPGRALRGLYHRQRTRQARRGDEERRVKPPSKEERAKEERRWSLVRISFVLVPVVGLWFLFAFLIPSPVGLVLPAIPYLALVFVAVAFLMFYGLLRASGSRWNTVYRTTLIWGVILGLIVSGMIALGGALFGCPFLPPAAAATAQGDLGWVSFGTSPWHENGLPTLYFYGATWCPYCSASSWAIWKALSGFGTVSNTPFMYSAEDSIPEVVLANAQVTSSYISFVVSEDTSGVQGNFPTTSNCVESAFVSAYSGSAIPFVVINGQYVHGSGTGAGSLINPSDVQTYTTAQMEVNVSTETGNPWTIVQGQTWWMMAFLAKACGATPSNLPSQPYYSGWTASTKSSVATDLAAIT
ncbi:MAG TPA: DUF929 family protein [Thermoplasmata archaeon]|jgi:hypothetical protein|nr:DUF929 family protein [Thermoplasmata archaeon]HYB78825.1 DUF929 family protein [Thermoplasmata archaeon]